MHFFASLIGKRETLYDLQAIGVGKKKYGNIFSALPREIVTVILGFLDKRFMLLSVSLVCRQFRKYCMDPGCWISISYRRQRNLAVIFSKFHNIARSLRLQYALITENTAVYFPHLTTLYLGTTGVPSHMKRSEQFHERFISLHAQQLKKLSLKGTSLNWRNFPQFSFPNLHKLSLSKGTELHISSDTLLHLCSLYNTSEWNSKLKYLSLRGLSDISNDCVKQVLSSCTALQYLSIQDCQTLTGEIFAQFDPVHIHTFKLRVIGDQEGFQPEQLEQLFRKMKKLKHLKVVRVSAFDSSTIQALVEQGVKLEQLNLQYCSDFTDFSAELIAQCCTESLRVLIIENLPLSHEALNLWLSKLKMLQRLSVFSIKPFNDATLQQIVANCNLLYFLRLYGLQVTDDGMKYLVGCSELGRLFVSECPNLTLASLQTVCEGCKCLNEVDFQNSRNVKYGAKMALLDKYPHLKNLYEE